MKDVKSIIASWPDKIQASAERLIDTYGTPDEFTQSLLIWHDTDDGWKRSILSKYATPHNFPDEHLDYLEQCINYRVPTEFFSPLAEFDGSVVVDRIRGELSARCGGTSMNFVAINLAHDIITEKRSITQAREEYVKLYQEYQEKNKKPPYTQSFQFDLSQKKTGDPDIKVL